LYWKAGEFKNVAIIARKGGFNVEIFEAEIAWRQDVTL